MNSFAIVTTNGDIEHHGVLGQKWGVRRYQNSDGSLTPAGAKRYGEGGKNAHSSKASGHRVMAKVYDINEKTYTKMGNKTLASMNRAAKNEQIKKANEAQRAANDSKNAKIERKSNIKSVTKELNSQASIGEKLLYNNATRKQAAKYVVDKNMSYEEATARAKKDAIRNTVAFCAVYGGITYAALKKMS